MNYKFIPSLYFKLYSREHATQEKNEIKRIKFNLDWRVIVILNIHTILLIYI